MQTGYGSVSRLKTEASPEDREDVWFARATMTVTEGMGGGLGGEAGGRGRDVLAGTHPSEIPNIAPHSPLLLMPLSRAHRNSSYTTAHISENPPGSRKELGTHFMSKKWNKNLEKGGGGV